MSAKKRNQIKIFFKKKFLSRFGVSAGKRDQIEIFFKKKLLSKIDVDLIIWSRAFIILKKNFLSIWSLFPALTPYKKLQVIEEPIKLSIHLIDLCENNYHPTGFVHY